MDPSWYARLVLPITYRYLMPDGSVEIYAQFRLGPLPIPRRIFLSRVIDPQGNAATLNS